MQPARSERRAMCNLGRWNLIELALQRMVRESRSERRTMCNLGRWNLIELALQRLVRESRTVSKRAVEGMKNRGEIVSNGCSQISPTVRRKECFTPKGLL